MAEDGNLRRTPHHHQIVYNISLSTVTLGRGRILALSSFLNGRVFGHRTSSSPLRVLGLPGWGKTAQDLLPTLTGLAGQALDLPGFGASPPPPEPWGASEYAQLIEPILSEMESPVLLGHSFGGRVALFLAVRNPTLVQGLVLTGVPLLRLRPPTRPALCYRILRQMSRWGLLSERRLENIRRRTGSADYRAARGVMRDTLVRVIREDYREQLPQIACPIRLVWGEQDPEVPLAVAEQSLSILRSAGVQALLTVAPDGGHQLPTTHPGLLRQQIESLWT